MCARFSGGTPSSEGGERFPIQTVEQLTGVNKELLRMWERRYGFPAPERTAKGDRLYSPGEVAKLRLMRRLIGDGHRPGKLAAMGTMELEGLCVPGIQGSRHILVRALEAELVGVLGVMTPEQLTVYLQDQLNSRGLYSFIIDFMQLANVIVGDAWMKGLITVQQEHAYSDAVTAVVRQGMQSLRPGIYQPRVMLATVPDELHTLGLLMVEALLRLDGIDVLNAGGEMTVPALVTAAARHEIDVVALSFSASFPGSKAVMQLEELRFRLPSGIRIWAGGDGITSRRRSVEGVDIIKDLDGVRLSTVRWRQEHLPRAVTADPR